MNTDTANPAPAIGIRFDMTFTQALELAEGISCTAGVLRDDIGATNDIPKETQHLLYGSLCLITHAARTLTDFVEMAEKGGDRHA